MPARTRQKITFAEMRAAGVRGPLIYCSDFRCSHHTTISGDRSSDDVRLFRYRGAFSSAKLVAGAAPTCGRIFIGRKRPDVRRFPDDPRRA
jgi:hypothetical protein